MAVKRTPTAGGVASQSTSASAASFKTQMLKDTPSSPPQCSVNTDAMSYPRRIGYYELFNIYDDCNVIEPESLLIEPFTHINLAFVNFGDDFKLKDTYGNTVDRMSFLKFTHPGLRVNIAVGGWAFSDPPTQYLWTQSKGPICSELDDVMLTLGSGTLVRESPDLH